jgi:hypothetical protein
MGASDKDVEAIIELERRRFAAVVAGLRQLRGDVPPGSDPHPLDRDHRRPRVLPGHVPRRPLRLPPRRPPHHEDLVSGDAALALGEMNADLTVGGVRKQLRNSSLAVWVRDGET